MLSSQVKFSADRKTDRQTDTGKTTYPRSIDVRIVQKAPFH